jgi:hypothetical protein
MVSVPDYATCKLYCLGKTPNCPHYEQYKKPFKVCLHYKLVTEHATEVLNFTERDQKTLEELAKNGKLG